MKLSIKQFATNVGNHTTAIREAANAFHEAYTDATPTQQGALRKDWMLGHLEGQGVKDAERTFSLGKGKGAKPENVKAIDRASSDFRYYVVRPVKAKPAQLTNTRISAERKAVAMDFLGNFEGETLQEQIKQALALLNALK
jgi:hypothetical protein